MARISGLTGLLLAAVLGGCNSSNVLHRNVDAQFEPGGRPMAIMPFTARGDRMKRSDGIVLAMLATMKLRAELPGQRVMGPVEMKDRLVAGADPVEVGRKAGAEVVVVGEITYLSIHRDDMLRTWIGSIGARFRVLDVSTSPPKALAAMRERRFNLPAELGQKFDPRYETIGKTEFRNELFLFAARRIAWFFYDHREATWSVNKTDVKLWKE